MKQLTLAPLPHEAMKVLGQLNATPQLVAHLTLVHDVAVRISKAFLREWPQLPVQYEQVLLGAAIHDIGKTAFLGELTGLGSEHERAGERLLLEHGFSNAIARIARTHGEASMDQPLEDLLVKLADKVWKGKRDEQLETAIVVKISESTGVEDYTIFGTMDAILTKIANHAEKRLLWQATHRESPESAG